MTKLAVLATLALAVSGGAVLAHSNGERIAEQALAIEEGRRSGEITWTEGRLLRKDQREIVRVKAEFEADGVLTRAERRVLHRMQDEAEARINEEATDARHRASFLPRIGR